MEKTISHVTVGNVFEDLGFPPDEAASLARKTDLMLALERIMKKDRLKSVVAAKRFGVSKEVIAHLKSGDLTFFTADMLMQMLERAGKKVEIVISEKKPIRAA